MKVLIADDEPIARAILREHLTSLPGLELVGEASTGPEAIQSILDLKPDLVFLDQQMPQLEGLEVVRALQSGSPPLIVFVTAYQQHALEAFEVGAVDYLLKPVRRERLEQAVEKARRVWKPPTHDALRRISGRRGSDIYLLNPDQIIAFQAEGDVVYIIAAESGDRYYCEHSLKELETKLEPARFRRVHRSTIINTDHIKRISPLSSKRWLLQMTGGFEATVSKRLKTTLRENL